MVNGKKSDDEHDRDIQIVNEWIALAADAAIGAPAGALLGFFVGDASGCSRGSSGRVSPQPRTPSGRYGSLGESPIQKGEVPNREGDCAGSRRDGKAAECRR